MQFAVNAIIDLKEIQTDHCQGGGAGVKNKYFSMVPSEKAERSLSYSSGRHGSRRHSK